MQYTLKQFGTMVGVGALGSVVVMLIAVVGAKLLPSAPTPSK